MFSTTYYLDHVSNVSYLQFLLCGYHPEREKIDLLEIDLSVYIFYLNFIFRYNRIYASVEHKQDKPFISKVRLLRAHARSTKKLLGEYNTLLYT